MCMLKNIPFVLIKKSLALAVVSLLGACATGQSFKTVEALKGEEAQVYVYRKFNLYHGGNVHRLIVDGSKDKLSLSTSSWRRINLVPGVHSIQAHDFFNYSQCGALQFELKPGQTLYVRDQIDTMYASGTTYVSCKIQFIPEEQALSDLNGLAEEK